MASSQTLFIYLLTLAIIEPKSNQQGMLSRAYYKHSGLEATASQFEKEQLPPELRHHIGTIAWIVKTASEQRVVIRFTFP